MPILTHQGAGIHLRQPSGDGRFGVAGLRWLPRPSRWGSGLGPVFTSSRMPITTTSGARWRPFAVDSHLAGVSLPGPEREVVCVDQRGLPLPGCRNGCGNRCLIAEADGQVALGAARDPYPLGAHRLATEATRSPGISRTPAGWFAGHGGAGTPVHEQATWGGAERLQGIVWATPDAIRPANGQHLITRFSLFIHSLCFSVIGKAWTGLHQCIPQEVIQMVLFCHDVGRPCMGERHERPVTGSGLRAPAC